MVFSSLLGILPCVNKTHNNPSLHFTHVHSFSAINVTVLLQLSPFSRRKKGSTEGSDPQTLAVTAKFGCSCTGQFSTLPPSPLEQGGIREQHPNPNSCSPGIREGHRERGEVPSHGQQVTGWEEKDSGWARRGLEWISGKKNSPGRVVKHWKGPSRISVFSADSAWDWAPFNFWIYTKPL